MKIIMITILAERKAGHLNIKTKMLNFEARVLIGWLSESVRLTANHNACLKVKHFAFMLSWPVFLTASI